MQDRFKNVVLKLRVTGVEIQIMKAYSDGLDALQMRSAMLAVQKALRSHKIQPAVLKAGIKTAYIEGLTPS